MFKIVLETSFILEVWPSLPEPIYGYSTFAFDLILS